MDLKAKAAAFLKLLMRKPLRLTPVRQLSNEGKIGRNDECHCGSKVKYKFCCWPKEARREQMIREAMIDEREAHKSRMREMRKRAD